VITTRTMAATLQYFAMCLMLNLSNPLFAHFETPALAESTPQLQVPANRESSREFQKSIGCLRRLQHRPTQLKNGQNAGVALHRKIPWYQGINREIFYAHYAIALRRSKTEHDDHLHSMVQKDNAMELNGTAASVLPSAFTMSNSQRLRR
jgi:hypothetical protein